jgi:hypothetical protein
MELKKINNELVKPIANRKLTKDNIKGSSIFSELYCNVFICAKKKSGKSSLIWKILKDCSDSDTKIIIFSATVDKDKTYKHIKKYFSEQPLVTFTSIIENKVDNLNEILLTLRSIEDPVSESDDDEKKEVVNPFYFIYTEEDAKKEERKIKKKKKLAPEIIFVFDDLSTELRNKTVATLLKSNRHYKSKVLISSQYPNDLKPESIKQMDYVILFGGHDEVKLEKFYRDLDLSISVERFKEMYKFATQKKFNFLYIDTVNETFRVNLNQEIVN